MTAVIFFIMAALALAGALGVVLSRNPVHSALWLVVTLISVAVFFLLQQAALLAAVQIIVYAGAIVVLFLFVIMLLGVDKHESLHDPIPFQRPAAIVLGVIVLGRGAVPRRPPLGHRAVGRLLHAIKGGATDPAATSNGSPAVLFTDYLWPFEVTAVLLVIAVVGGVVLARRSGRPPNRHVEGKASRVSRRADERAERQVSS